MITIREDKIINYNDLKRVWLPNQEEIKNYVDSLNRFKIRVPENIKQPLIGCYNQVEKETIEFIEENEKKGKWTKLSEEELLCYSCGNKLEFWKYGLNWDNVEVGIYKCKHYPKCSGCFREDYEKTPPLFGSHNPSYTYKDKIIHLLKNYNINITEKQLDRYLESLELPSLFSKYITPNNENLGVYKKLRKRTDTNENIILNKLINLFRKEKVIHRLWIRYELKNGKCSHKIPDFVIFDNSQIIIIDEKKRLWDIDDSQIENYHTLLGYLHKDKIFIKCFIMEQKDEDFYDVNYYKEKYPDYKLFFIDNLDELKCLL